jgi:hypothetical protein
MWGDGCVVTDSGIDRERAARGKEIMKVWVTLLVRAEAVVAI